MLSIILPTFNEMRSGYFTSILASLANLEDTEVFVVDGGSEDGTVEKTRQYPYSLISAPNSTRAARLNLGIDESKGDLVFLHHPRSLVETTTFGHLAKFRAESDTYWGGLTHQFDASHPVLRFTSWYSNHVRFDQRGIVYLDHCLFFHGAFRDKGMRLPDIAIFEDTEFSLALRQYARPERLAAIAQTSAIRFQQNGVLKQSWLNQRLKLARWASAEPEKMNAQYEEGLGLNKK